MVDFRESIPIILDAILADTVWDEPDVDGENQLTCTAQVMIEDTKDDKKAEEIFTDWTNKVVQKITENMEYKDSMPMLSQALVRVALQREKELEEEEKAAELENQKLELDLGINCARSTNEDIKFSDVLKHLNNLTTKFETREAQLRAQIKMMKKKTLLVKREYEGLLKKIKTFKEDFGTGEFKLPEMPAVKRAVEEHMRGLRRLMDRQVVESEEKQAFWRWIMQLSTDLNYQVDSYATKNFMEKITWGDSLAYDKTAGGGGGQGISKISLLDRESDFGDSYDQQNSPSNRLGGHKSSKNIGQKGSYFSPGRKSPSQKGSLKQFNSFKQSMTYGGKSQTMMLGGVGGGNASAYDFEDIRSQFSSLLGQMRNVTWFGWAASRHRKQNSLKRIEWQTGHYGVILSLRMVMSDGMYSPIFGGGCGCGCKGSTDQKLDLKVNLPVDTPIKSYKTLMSVKGSLLGLVFTGITGEVLLEIKPEQRISGTKEEVYEVGSTEKIIGCFGHCDELNVIKGISFFLMKK